MSSFSDAIEVSVDKGVTERPPIPGKHYVAFVVHPRQPGPVTLAIAHREGEMRIVDLCRKGLTIQQAADLSRAYDVDHITGAEEEDGETLAHAVSGAIYLLRDA